MSDNTDDCPTCAGSGSVRAMTTDRGPDDYEFDAECPACRGTGSNDLREALKTLPCWTHRTDVTRTVVALEDVLRVVEARATRAAQALPCGHPAQLLLKSAETGEPLYCELCDDKSGRRDAEARESELAAANATLRKRAEEAEADAARYRWLRVRWDGEGAFDLLSAPDPHWGAVQGDECDAAIDAARKETPNAELSR